MDFLFLVNLFLKVPMDILVSKVNHRGRHEDRASYWNHIATGNEKIQPAQVRMSKIFVKQYANASDVSKRIGKIDQERNGAGITERG